MKYAGHQSAAIECRDRLVAPGEGFQKNEVVVSSLDEKQAAKFVRAARSLSRRLMAERESDIDAGIEHLAPAAEMKRGTWKL